MRILLCEDERSLSRAIFAILQKNNYSVDAVYNGIDALDYIETENYDGVILDIMMPGLDGFSVLKRVRSKGIKVPILILSAKAETDDKVLGLDLGANDYLTKPFDAKELLARIRAMTRPYDQADDLLRSGNVSLSCSTFELTGPLGSYKLANKEFQMLEMLLLSRGRLISTEHFMERIWGYDSEAELNVVWVYVSYLRKKLSAIGANVSIKAQRNSGYYLEVASP